MSHIDHITKAAINSHRSAWGFWAARRYIMKRCGYNEATAIRVLQACKLCLAADAIGC